MAVSNRPTRRSECRKRHATLCHRMIARRKLRRRYLVVARRVCGSAGRCDPSRLRSDQRLSVAAILVLRCSGSNGEASTPCCMSDFGFCSRSIYWSCCVRDCTTISFFIASHLFTNGLLFLYFIISSPIDFFAILSFLSKHAFATSSK